MKALSALLLALPFALADSYTGKSPLESFDVLSADLNSWDDAPSSSLPGLIIGGVVFGIAYLFTIGFLFYDI